jgi:hypothetical protein
MECFRQNPFIGWSTERELGNNSYSNQVNLTICNMTSATRATVLSQTVGEAGEQFAETHQ